MKGKKPREESLAQVVVRLISEAAHEEVVQTDIAPYVQALGPLSCAFTREELVALAKRLTPEQVAWDWMYYVDHHADWVFDVFESGWRRRIHSEYCEHARKEHVGNLARCRDCGARFLVTKTYTLIEEQKETVPHG